MMMALDGGLGLSKQQYHATPLPDTSSSPARFATARDVLWERLSPLPFFALVLEGGGFAHVGTSKEYLTLLTRPSRFAGLYHLGSAAAVYVKQQQPAEAPVEAAAAKEAAGGAGDSDATPAGKKPRMAPLALPSAAYSTAALGVTAETIAAGGVPLAALGEEGCPPTFSVLNSILSVRAPSTAPALSPFGAGSVVEHSHLEGAWRIGAGCLVSSVRSLPGLVVRSGTAVQELRVTTTPAGPGSAPVVGRVVSVIGVSDGIKDAYTKPTARINGLPWADVFALSGATPDDIWPGGATSVPANCTIWTAKLWPVLPLSEGALPLPKDDLDLACLWLQWAAPLSAAEAAETGAGCASAVRAAAVAPKVLYAWKSAVRVSLKDILALADATTEFAWRRDLRSRVDVASLVLTAHGSSSAQASASSSALPSAAALVRRLGRAARGAGIGPALPGDYSDSLVRVAQGADDGSGSSSHAGKAAVAAAASWSVSTPVGCSAEFAWAALLALDRVASSAPADTAARALSIAALLMWGVAGWGTAGGGSGPSHHADWAGALALLEAEGADQRALTHAAVRAAAAAHAARRGASARGAQGHAGAAVTKEATVQRRGRDQHTVDPPRASAPCGAGAGGVERHDRRAAALRSTAAGHRGRAGRVEGRGRGVACVGRGRC